MQIKCIALSFIIGCNSMLYGLERLRNDYQWPSKKPNVPVWEMSLFRNAKPLRKIMSEHSILTIVELGSWLGGSAKFFLHAAPHATVIAIDHWIGVDCQSYKDIAPIDALYETFLVNCWEYQARLIPLKMKTVHGLKKVSSYYIKPDLIYIDAAHDYDSVMRDIALSYELFPHAIITGDDWRWHPHEGYPVRRAVIAFAKVKNLKIYSEGNFWMYVR